MLLQKQIDSINEDIKKSVGKLIKEELLNDQKKIKDVVVIEVDDTIEKVADYSILINLKK